jgi:hypothetical protein
MKPAIKLLTAIATIGVLALAADDSVAQMRPLLLEGTRLALPLLPGQDEATARNFNQVYAVAAQGDWALVSATRSVGDPEQDRSGAYLFQRTAPGVWNHAGALEDSPGNENLFVFVEGNVAVVSRLDSFRVFERNGGTWSESEVVTPSGRYVLALDNGIIHTHMIADCSTPVQHYQKGSDGRWSVTGNTVQDNCDTATLDISGNTALFYSDPSGSGSERPGVWREVGAFNWDRVSEIHLPVGALAGGGSISGSTAAYYARDLAGGPYVMTESNGGWTLSGRFLATEANTGVNMRSPVLRGDYAVQQGYRTREQDEYSTLRIFRRNPSGEFEYFGRTNVGSMEGNWSLSTDGLRLVTATAAYGWGPVSLAHVFELPANYTPSAITLDDFEDGNIAGWQVVRGGQWDVLPTLGTRVLRQSSGTGDAGIELAGASWTDQYIETVVEPLGFNGNDRWFGLVLRHTDASNYYYVTFRHPGTVQIKRMRNGVFTTLASRPLGATLTPNFRYRIRFEVSGTHLRAYFGDELAAQAYDDTLTSGRPGIASYGVTALYDNVVASPGGWVVPMRLDDFDYDYYPAGWTATGVGAWGIVDTGYPADIVLTQSSTAGDARYATGVVSGDQVIRTRVRATAFAPPPVNGTASDRWFGVMARYVDERNYYYLSVRNNNTLQLRRLLNGQIHVLASTSLGAHLNDWYNLRLEVIGAKLHAFVNGELKLQATDSTFARGLHGLVTYKTAADYDYVFSEQP